VKPHPCIQKIYGCRLHNLSFDAEKVDHTFLTHLLGPEGSQNPDPFSELKQFTPTKQSIFAYALACTLMHLHASNITHRNINSRSVCVDRQFLPIILMISVFHPQNQFRGMKSLFKNDNAIFEAPENFKGDSFDSKVDVFSYGSNTFNF